MTYHLPLCLDCSDYSAAYVELHTEDKNLSGQGMTFTIGRGQEIVRSSPAFPPFPTFASLHAPE
jgi:hypothetical protein